MRIALVHDYLNQLGGGERVLSVLMEMFPDAPVFTPLHDPVKTNNRFSGRIRGTSFLDFQFARDHHRLFIPFMPLAARSINLGSDFDLIISDTAGFAKGISYNSKTTKHLSYIHTPLRYAWETETYFDNSPKNLAMKIFAAPAFAYVRHWDYNAGQRPDLLLANSHYIAEKVKNYYHRAAEVVYPPVDPEFFRHESFPSSHSERSEESRSYYLAAGRLLPYKRFDLVIDAFAKLNLPLKIVGSGHERAALERLSELRTKHYGLSTNPIEFLGQASETQLRDLYTNARALIMPNDEDFGLVMAEAQACGTPVIAYNAGGAREIVTPETGLLFNEQTPESLAAAVHRFEKMTFDPAMIRHSARRFTRTNFETGIRQAVKKLLSGA
ncbi:MAG: glycosyl transferase [Candidatus Harrisonbacteria bacterium CG10_big_fil_rev_8_21_14_0_10_49_15]|uniref:Glycosyl transferase n=1 Tax=Candidatus Harrisonbacteria bacterium CG10_big_fil_rev_8_21_14_0_10_49_15 TaxID=1974587 RepID=A0A2H0UKP6_9BACT|nr:MAG: glycosyl transferase [Candidatus Harrisonbacteria bacterium CG10_big_fil_rev_8_21_14_0_10_49_15]